MQKCEGQSIVGIVFSNDCALKMYSKIQKDIQQEAFGCRIQKSIKERRPGTL